MRQAKDSSTKYLTALETEIIEWLEKQSVLGGPHLDFQFL